MCIHLLLFQAMITPDGTARSQVRQPLTHVLTISKHAVTLSFSVDFVQCMFSRRSGLVVTCLIAVHDIPGLNPIIHSLCLLQKHTAICSLQHWLHTITAVSRSTQPVVN